MRDLLNNNGKLVTLMGSLFAGIIAVTGAVALFLGDIPCADLHLRVAASRRGPEPSTFPHCNPPPTLL